MLASRFAFSLVCLFSWLAAGFAALPAHAQIGLYAEFGGSKIDAPSNDWIYGPTFGIYADFLPLPFIHLGADLRGSVLGPGQDTKLYSGLLGPRLSLHPHVVSLNPYAEALFGIGHADVGAGPGSDSTQFEYQFLAGIDHTVIPRLDWRVIEFSYGGIGVFNGTLHPKTISTGLVLRIP